jgi:aminoglycoside 6'-N-acetyltransferase
MNKVHSLVKNGSFSIRLMYLSDLPLMASWLGNEALTPFFGPKMNEKEVVRKYKPRITGKIPIVPCIAEIKGRPIGFVQYYFLKDKERTEYGYNESSPIFGMDQFIGDAELWGKGTGTLLVESMSNFLFTEKNAELITLDPKSDNIRAISCYQKCGFKKVKRLDNNRVLMETRNPNHHKKG